MLKSPFHLFIEDLKSQVKEMAESEHATAEEYGALTRVLQIIDELEESYGLKPIFGGDDFGGDDDGEEGQNKKASPWSSATSDNSG